MKPELFASTPLAQRDRILDMLACPACQSGLRLVQTEAAVSSIHCMNCQRRFPILDGIPILIAEAEERCVSAG
jgi:uncharacterized protein YbaR (Trm112 family)